MITARRSGRLMLSIMLVFSALAIVAVDSAPGRAASSCRTYTLDKADRLQFSDLDNTSGMVASRVMSDVFWVHNDRNGVSPNTVYAIDGLGRLLAEITFELDAADDTVIGNFSDIEDIAIGPGPVLNADYLYIADTGDNARNRAHVAVYRFLEPSFDPDPAAPKSLVVTEASMDGQRFTYERHGDPTKTESRDAEAIFVDPEDGDLYIFEKGTHSLVELGEGADATLSHSLVYRIRRSKLFVGDTVRTAAIVSYIRHRYDGQALDGSRITGADISRDGHVVVLRNNEKSFYWYREPGTTLPSVFDADTDAPCMGPDGTRGESVAILPDGSAFYGLREGADPLLSPIFRAEIDGYGRVECYGLEATSADVVGTEGDDVIFGTDGDDVIVALGGNDVIDAGKGHDVICAGEGNDTVRGRAGADLIFGLWGKDVLKGDSGKDVIYGGINADKAIGGSGNDRVYGGEHGDDVLGKGGRDKLWGDRGGDSVSGGGADDIVRGNVGNDSLSGGSGTDACDGGGGTDIASDDCETKSKVP